MLKVGIVVIRLKCLLPVLPPQPIYSSKTDHDDYAMEVDVCGDRADAGQTNQ